MAVRRCRVTIEDISLRFFFYLFFFAVSFALLVSSFLFFPPGQSEAEFYPTYGWTNWIRGRQNLKKTQHLSSYAVPAKQNCL